MIYDERSRKNQKPGTSRATALGEMLTGLITDTHLSTMEQVPGVVAAHAARAGFEDLLIYLADLQQDVLFLLAEEGLETGEHPTEIPIEGTVPGRAFQHGAILPASPTQDSDEWWAPLLDSTERVGLLRVTVPATDRETMRDIRCLADLVTLIIVSKRGVSDSYARLVRRRYMNVAAEMQWRMTPPRTFATNRVIISAVMEPAYEVSGDAFDYSFDENIVHLSVFDAMGHDTAAGLTSNLAMAASRNSRRQGAGLIGVGEAIEHVLCEQFNGRRYATGILAQLDATTGDLHWINHGHPPPVVIRDGRFTVGLECPPAPPMGTGLDIAATLCHDQLQPGDRLLLYTDGITEARSPQGQEFGLARFTDFLIRHHADGLPVPETLRRLIRHHLDYHHGRLGDDATVLVLEWHGPAPYMPGHAESLVGLPEAGVHHPGG